MLNYGNSMMANFLMEVYNQFLGFGGVKDEVIALPKSHGSAHVIMVWNESSVNGLIFIYK